MKKIVWVLVLLLPFMVKAEENYNYWSNEYIEVSNNQLVTNQKESILFIKRMEQYQSLEYSLNVNSINKFRIGSNNIQTSFLDLNVENNGTINCGEYQYGQGFSACNENDYCNYLCKINRDDSNLDNINKRFTSYNKKWDKCSNSYIKGSVSLPVKPANITREFRYKSDIYITGFHTGLDFGGTEGATPVYAIANGTVVKSSYSASDYGYYVIIEHNGYNNDGSTYKIRSLYAHMYTKPLVNVGDKVIGGTQIGIVGKTGKYDYGPHLHLEIRVGDQNGDGTSFGYRDFVDPTPYIERIQTGNSELVNINPKETSSDCSIYHQLTTSYGTEEQSRNSIQSRAYVGYKSTANFTPYVSFVGYCSSKEDSFEINGTKIECTNHVNEDVVIVDYLNISNNNTEYMNINSKNYLSLPIVLNFNYQKNSQNDDKQDDSNTKQEENKDKKSEIIKADLEKEDNPKTADLNVYLIILMIVGASITGVYSYINRRKLKI